jgi:hypothetical protein
MVGLSLVVGLMSCSRCEARGHSSLFGYRWDACERWSVLATGVTPMSLWPLITMGNLGASPFLDVG